MMTVMWMYELGEKKDVKMIDREQGLTKKKRRRQG
jgi:hypothetical protein